MAKFPEVRPSASPDDEQVREADGALALTVHPPRLVPLPAEQRGAAVDLLADLFDQWRRARSAQT